MAKGKRNFIAFVVLIAVLAVTHGLWMPMPARFLVVKDNIQKADAVVVLSGDWEFNRERTAAQLYRQGFAGRIVRILEKDDALFRTINTLFNLNTTQAEVFGKFFESQGILSGDIILGDAVATSTFDELKAAREIVLKNNFKSFILVTSDYHMRRSLMTARWIFKSDDIRIYNATAYTRYFMLNDWWLHERPLKEITQEYLNCAFYLIYHFMLGK
jgi:uncharacterized SAM-binding protein YcdF (DUF218 family)